MIEKVKMESTLQWAGREWAHTVEVAADEFMRQVYTANALLDNYLAADPKGGDPDPDDPCWGTDKEAEELKALSGDFEKEAEKLIDGCVDKMWEIGDGELHEVEMDEEDYEGPWRGPLFRQY